jgi:hypothetical protein
MEPEVEVEVPDVEVSDDVQWRAIGIGIGLVVATVGVVWGVRTLIRQCSDKDPESIQEQPTA